MLELIKATTRVTRDIELHLSLSQLKTFLSCPYRYALRYVRGLKAETKSMDKVLVYAVRLAVEEYYLHLKDHEQTMPLDRMLAVFESALMTVANKPGPKITHPMGQSLDSIRDQGMRLVQTFHAGAHPQDIVDIEYPFAVPVPDIVAGGELPIRLAGIIDLIERDATGNHHAVSLRIVSKQCSGASLDYDMESIVVSYAMTELGLAPRPESCTVRHDTLLNTDNPSLEQCSINRSAADHQRLIHTVNVVIRTINQGNFHRNIGPHCAACPFITTCQPR